MRDATLRDVAQLAGVSARTVSNVVNGYARVTERTRVKVERAIVELDYRPNVLARNLANGRSGQIAVVVPYLDTPYFAELLQGIIPRARERGYNVLIDQTDGDPVHERELIRRGARGFAFDGMILSPLGLAQADLSDHDASLPLVILGERTSASTFDHVGIDDVQASREATRHLLDLGLAHEDAGLAVDESLVIGTPRFNRADGAGAMTLLLDRDDPPDAAFCYSDLVALGALHAALERGLRVPEDIALIGYDDIEEGRYSNPTISTISPDKTAIAATAVDRLLQRIGSSPERLPGIEVRATHRLVARQSTVGRLRG